MNAGFIPGVDDHLKPNTPAVIPEAPGAGDAMAQLSPFKEALDWDQIINNLVLDRPLKLYIPDRDKYPEWEFFICNGTPQAMASAKNKGFVPVTDEKLSGLFKDLVAGTDEDGKAFRPILMARSKKVGQHVQKRHRQQLQSLYAGMDPTKREIGGKYATRVDGVGMSQGSFEGPAFRIRV